MNKHYIKTPDPYDDSLQVLRHSMQEAQDRFLGYHTPTDLKKAAFWQDSGLYYPMIQPEEELTVNNITYSKTEMSEDLQPDILEKRMEAKKRYIAQLNDPEFQRQKKLNEERRVSEWKSRYSSFFFNEKQKDDSEEEYSTDFLEFRTGRYSEDYKARPDSKFCFGGLWNDIHLTSLFQTGEAMFDFYGNTEFNQTQWNVIVKNAQERGGFQLEFIKELKSWVNECFSRYDMFTIYGE